MQQLPLMLWCFSAQFADAITESPQSPAFWRETTMTRSPSDPPSPTFVQRKTQATDVSCVYSYGGRGWIRTTEVTDNRFTVCPLWPLGNSPIFFWSWWTDSNPRPADYKSAALPTELHQHFFVLSYNSISRDFCQQFFRIPFCFS